LVITGTLMVWKLHNSGRNTLISLPFLTSLSKVACKVLGKNTIKK
jgi:hypothetical protein